MPYRAGQVISRQNEFSPRDAFDENGVASPAAQKVGSQVMSGREEIFMGRDGGFACTPRIQPAMRVLGAGVLVGACVALLAYVLSNFSANGGVTIAILALFAFALAALTGIAKTTTA